MTVPWWRNDLQPHPAKVKAERRERAGAAEAWQRARERHEAKLDQAADELEAERRKAAEAPPRDPVEVLREELDARTRPLDRTATGPAWPAGSVLWANEVERRIAEREDAILEEREEAARLPALRGEWEERQREIIAARNAALIAADAAHAEAKAAAIEEARAALAELGDYPTLMEAAC